MGRSQAVRRVLAEDLQRGGRDPDRQGEKGVIDFQEAKCPVCGGQFNGALFKDHGPDLIIGIYMHLPGAEVPHEYAHIAWYEVPAMVKQVQSRKRK